MLPHRRAVLAGSIAGSLAASLHPGRLLVPPSATNRATVSRKGAIASESGATS
jgi:hypothetical protein